ncbi:MAG: YecH family protein [Candidatus Omnitrophica bacterium]|nr:YecH family protein [Candidatus Omnitrophota bacterium]
MSESIHGHEVIEMMMQAEKPYTKQSLEAALIEKYGSRARFHTCSASNLSAADLIEFLAARGKFMAASDQSFNINPDRVCRDHH